MEIKKTYENVSCRGEVEMTSSRLASCLEVEEKLEYYHNGKSVPLEEMDKYHPDGKIRLRDGRLIEGFQKSKKPEMGLPKDVIERSKMWQCHKEKMIFLNNAFVFLENSERILSDSRMFLCPIPIQSEMTDVGTSGFNCPTLGVYIEWWMNCEKSKVKKNEQLKWLVYHIAGTPLSGKNHCGLVNRKGKTITRSIYPSRDVWSSFIDINRSYISVRNKYDAYTLFDVLDIFQEEGRIEVKKLKPIRKPKWRRIIRKMWIIMNHK